jgi:hypothetical protein
MSRLLRKARTEVPAAIGCRSKPRPTRQLLLLLNGSEIIDDRAHLLGFEDEFRHVRMTGRKALRQGFSKAFDFVFAGERSEGRRVGVGARAGTAHGMAASTVGRQQRLAASCRRAAFLW